jgi:hypothetical protein
VEINAEIYAAFQKKEPSKNKIFKEYYEFSQEAV